MTTLPIQLPSRSIVMVKPGDTVHVGDVVAKKEVLQEIAIDLAAAFRVAPKQVKKHLRKNPGDSVVDGEVIASRTKLFGMQEEKILSHVTGTVSKYDRTSGVLSVILQPEEESGGNEEIRSPIDGIVELCDNDKILIKTDKNVLIGISGVGGVGEAEIYLLEEEKKLPSEVAVQLHHMDIKIIDKILLGGIMDRDVLVKAIGMGVAGVAAAHIRDEDMEYLKERAIDVPVIKVDSEDFPKLVKWNGKKVFMNGSGKTILFLNK
jgi:hypothetical protein